MTIFFDTSVLAHRFDLRDLRKQKRARELWRHALLQGEAGISAQVFAETLQMLSTQLQPSLSVDQMTAIADSLAPRVLLPLSAGLIIDAVPLAYRHQLSLAQATTLQAAIEAGAHTLYSEDLPAGLEARGVRVLNPFDNNVLAVEEPRATYRVNAQRLRRSLATAAKHGAIVPNAAPLSALVSSAAAIATTTATTTTRSTTKKKTPSQAQSQPATRVASSKRKKTASPSVKTRSRVS